jgi:competence protein ComEC
MVSYTTPSAAAKPRFTVVAPIWRALGDERERWALWLPVFLGAGVGVYFALPAEPHAWMAWLLALAGVVAFLLGRRQATGVAGVALLAFSIGFGAADVRTGAVSAPVLERAIPSAAVSGRILAVEPASRGPRVILGEVLVEGLAPSATPERVRIRLRATARDVRPGDRIAVRARLAPPPGASWPGGFDFSRQAWFQRLGAVGFAQGPADVRPADPAGPVARAEARVEEARAAIARRIMDSIEGPAGGVAAALATGLRGGITAEVRDQMRDSGLAHLLAISGLHLGLVAGFVFALVRSALVLWPAMALRVPAKKLAAASALLAAGIYLLLAGATVPTQRAFIMAAIVLTAVLVDRTGISLRLIA